MTDPRVVGSVAGESLRALLRQNQCYGRNLLKAEWRLRDREGRRIQFDGLTARRVGES